LANVSQPFQSQAGTAAKSGKATVPCLNPMRVHGQERIGSQVFAVADRRPLPSKGRGVHGPARGRLRAALGKGRHCAAFAGAPRYHGAIPLPHQPTSRPSIDIVSVELGFSIHHRHCARNRMEDSYSRLKEAAAPDCRLPMLDDPKDQSEGVSGLLQCRQFREGPLSSMEAASNRALALGVCIASGVCRRQSAGSTRVSGRVT
jgi:hypothetical protein